MASTQTRKGTQRSSTTLVTKHMKLSRWRRLIRQSNCRAQKAIRSDWNSLSSKNLRLLFRSRTCTAFQRSLNSLIKTRDQSTLLNKSHILSLHQTNLRKMVSNGAYWSAIRGSDSMYVHYISSCLKTQWLKAIGFKLNQDQCNLPLQGTSGLTWRLSFSKRLIKWLSL